MARLKRALEAKAVADGKDERFRSENCQSVELTSRRESRSGRVVGERLFARGRSEVRGVLVAKDFGHC